MADSDGVLFTGSAADRIADAVRWVERHRGRNTQSGEGEAPSPPVVYARLTSGDADGSGHYPAVITLYSAADAAWNDYSAVKVKAPNGETLANGTRYAVRPVGRTAGGDELYATLGGGGSGIGPAGVIYVPPAGGGTGICPAFRRAFDPVTRTFTATGQVAVLAIDVNGLYNSDDPDGRYYTAYRVDNYDVYEQWVITSALTGATAGHAGTVNTHDQTIAGRKTFASQVIVSQEATTPEIEMRLGVSCPLSTSFGWGVRIHGTSGPGEGGIYTHPTGGGILLHAHRSDVSGINGMLSVSHSGGGAWVANDGGGIAGVNFDFELRGKYKAVDYTTLDELGVPSSGVGWTGSLLGGVKVVSGIVCGGGPSTYTIDGGTW